ncbi:MAG: efflux RND transporter periplasmic adaptor subunit [Bacteroidaceae bacterium]
MRRLGKIQLLMLTVVALLSSCGGGNKKTVAAATVESKPKVKLASVKTQQVDQIADFTATVEANMTNNIAPSVSVRIEKIFVEVGDQVHKGQKLVQMDDVNLKQAKSQLDNLKIEFSRVDELYKVGGASRSEWDAKKTALDVAKTSYKNLVDNTSLTSPINGIVTARNYDDGDLFSTGNPVLTVEQISPVKLKINISESYFSQIKKGMNGEVKLDVYKDEIFNAKVSLIYPTIDAASRTFPVELTIANGNQRVRPGMFARVIMSFGVADHVVVPDQAIVKQIGSGDRFVYVYKDGKVAYNKVELGRRMGAEYELISGVENNSQVVVAGQSRLNNGAEVEVEK